MSEERRQAPRSRAMMRGQIVYKNGFCSMDCTVVDVSQGGARLQLADWMRVPERFELRVAYGPRRSATLVFLKGTTAGIRFDADSP